MASNSLAQKIEPGDFLVILQELIQSNQKLMEQVVSNLQAGEGTVFSKAGIAEFQNSMIYLSVINRLAKECATHVSKLENSGI